jgi:iron-sulfur cluster assembly protein
MGLSLTAGAASEVRRMIEERGRGIGIRLMVEPSECSGLAYSLQFVDEASGNDIVYESHGTKVVTDMQSLPLLDGTEIGFVSDADGSGFDIRNPNVKRSCGCGDSFYV